MANMDHDRTGRLFGLSTELSEDIKAALNEFFGTVVFLMLAYGGIQSAGLTIIATNGLQTGTQGPLPLDTWIYIAVSMGLGLLSSAWMFYRVTGGLFNPAVSLAILIVGMISFRRFVMYAFAQLVGGIVAAAIIHGLTPGPLLVGNKLSPGINIPQGLFIEVFATSFLVLSILMLAAEKTPVTPMAPVGIGLTFFACHLFAAPLTGAGLNPARAFGPAVVSGFPKTHWIYWVGPCFGSVLAAGFYLWLKHIKYWSLNPGQDATEEPIPEEKSNNRDASLDATVAARSDRNV